MFTVRQSEVRDFSRPVDLAGAVLPLSTLAATIRAKELLKLGIVDVQPENALNRTQIRAVSIGR